MRKKAGTLVPALGLGSPPIRWSVESNYDIFFVVRWASGDLQLPLQFGGGDSHALPTRVSPYFGQEVLVAQMMEHQLGARFARTSPLGQRVHRLHSLAVGDLD